MTLEILLPWLCGFIGVPIVNFINEWGLTLLGLSLIFGIFIKYSAPLGALLMLLYYLPLGVIHPDAHSFIVDDHVIFGLILIYFTMAGSGKWTLEGRWSKHKTA